MTDMRATERLLEVIEERTPETIELLVKSIDRHGDPDDLQACAVIYLRAIAEIITELRRRGDTLVRRDDLAYCLEHTFDVSGDMDVYHEHRARLENAIGGKP